jgi:hypothetical protein
MQAALSSGSAFCQTENKVTAHINNAESLEAIVTQLNPCHLAHRQYYELKAQAKWGRIAKSVITLGVVYNIVVLIIIAFYLR